MTTEIQDSATVAWSIFPMKESPAKAALFWCVLMFTVWAVWWNLQSIFLTIVATALLLGSLSSFYLPTEYRLDHGGASCRRWFYRRNMEWQRVRSVSLERDGIFLSPFPAKSRLENFRGLYLPSRANQNEIIAAIRHFAPDAVGLPGADPVSPTPSSAP